MTTTPEEPLSDDQLSTTPTGDAEPMPGDADGTDGDSTDSDGTDGDSTDSDGTDGDASDSDGTDGSAL